MPFKATSAALSARPPKSVCSKNAGLRLSAGTVSVAGREKKGTGDLPISERELQRQENISSKFEAVRGELCRNGEGGNGRRHGSVGKKKNKGT